MSVLTGEEISVALAGLDGWQFEPGAGTGGAIAKEYRWPSFAPAVAFVVQVGFAAEAANHHPDIDVRYDRVRLTLATHSEGGVTASDVEMAAEIERLATGHSKAVS